MTRHVATQDISTKSRAKPHCISRLTYRIINLINETKFSIHKKEYHFQNKSHVPHPTEKTSNSKPTPLPNTTHSISQGSPNRHPTATVTIRQKPPLNCPGAPLHHSIRHQNAPIPLQEKRKREEEQESMDYPVFLALPKANTKLHAMLIMHHAPPKQSPFLLSLCLSAPGKNSSSSRCALIH
jgi:hypothetical protein